MASEECRVPVNKTFESLLVLCETLYHLLPPCRQMAVAALEQDGECPLGDAEWIVVKASRGVPQQLDWVVAAQGAMGEGLELLVVEPE
jgi:hypothetical protein